MAEGLQNFDLTAFATTPFPQQRPKKPRYYSVALSQDDKEALAFGELNHNLKVWEVKDAIRLEESRKALTPRPTHEQHMEVEQARERRGPRIALELVHMQDGSDHSSQIAINTTASSASPVSQQRVSLSGNHRSPSSPFASGQTRSASAGDYFDQQHRSSTWQSCSSDRVLSPLSIEQRRYTPRREVTFDSMLAPHISGKGESFKGTDNAVKDDLAMEKNKKEHTKEHGAKKRLGKMRSMPLIFVRKNRDRISTVSE